MAEPEIRTDLRSRWRSYLATVLVLGIVAAIMVWALERAGRSATAHPAPAAFATPDWRCAPATDDHPVCWRELPPAAKPSPAPTPHTREAPDAAIRR